jgi:hypothetical protein
MTGFEPIILGPKPRVLHILKLHLVVQKVATMRLELITSCVSGRCSQPIELCHYKKCTENRIRTDKCLLTRQVLCQLSHPGINCIARMKRFELLSTVLETAILPLNYTRVYFCASTGTRTLNPPIKSRLLCQLSYRCKLCARRDLNPRPTG